MKRICLLGAAIAAILILGVASALAATPHATSKAGSTKSKSAKGTKLTCVDALTLLPPSNDTNVTPASQTGTWGGAAVCKSLGSGAEFEDYTLQDSGNLTGKWQEWFNTGSVYGTFSLTPSDTSEAPPSTTSFSAASYTGTFVIKNGTGAYAKVTGRGTETCVTKDSVHYACKVRGTDSLPAAKS